MAAYGGNTVYVFCVFPLWIYYYWKTNCWATLLEYGMAGGGGPRLFRLLK